MPRIIGVDVPGNKRLVIALTYIYGIGPHISEEIIQKLGLNPNERAKELTEDDIARINNVLQTDYLVEGDLRRKVNNDIKRLISIHSYRGYRHRIGMPVRGQKTQTNARTRKGPRKSIAGKKKAPTAK
jgi:small subunit ribosomal protein S13